MPQLASRHIEILMNQLSEDYVRCSPDGNGGTACTKIKSAKENPCVFAKPEVQWAAIGFFVVLLLVQMVRAKCQCRQRRDEKAGEV
ncbi:hypothetical protein DICA2_E12112 [Diutina catenulata]